MEEKEDDAFVGQEIRLKRNVLCDIFIIAAEHEMFQDTLQSGMASGSCVDESAGRGMNKTSMNKRQLQPIELMRAPQGTFLLHFMRLRVLRWVGYVAGGGFQDKRLLWCCSAQKTKTTPKMP